MIRKNNQCFAVDKITYSQEDVLDVEKYDELLDFEIEKCYQAIAATAKLLSSAILNYSLFATTTAVLFFGASKETEISVPLIGIKVPIEFAIILTLFLMNFSLWWVWSTILLINRLQAKFWDLMHDRHGLIDDHRWSNHLLIQSEFISIWHLQIPTLPTVLLDSLGEDNIIRYSINFLCIAISFLFPIYVAANLGLSYPLIVTTLILFLVGLTFRQIFRIVSVENPFFIRRRALRESAEDRPITFTDSLTLTSLSPKKAINRFGKDIPAWILLLGADDGLILSQRTIDTSAMFIFMSEEAVQRFRAVMESVNSEWRSGALITKKMTLDRAIALARFEELDSFVITVDGTESFFSEYIKFLGKSGVVSDRKL